MSGPDQLNISNEVLLDAIEVIAVRLNAQEAILAAVAAKLKITKAEAFDGLDSIDLGEMDYWLPKIRRAILQTLNDRH